MENFGVNFSDQKVEDFQIHLPPWDRGFTVYGTVAPSVELLDMVPEIWEVSRFGKNT